MKLDLRNDLLVIATIILVAMCVVFGVPATHSYADPLAKQQEAGCTQFAKVGMWEVYHCVDQNGHEFEANSAGMMIAVGN